MYAQKIYEYCLECSDHVPRNTLLCASKNCPLYPYRFGTKSIDKKLFLRIKRKKCKDCGEDITMDICKTCKLYVGGKNGN